MPFIHDDFLLHTDAARRLYHGHAAPQPIIDYHNHLPAREIAADRRFATLYDVWLAGDHYKWRAMRAAGIGEEYCTGDAPPRDKFLAWARAVPQTLRNPLYHWTHLELARTFGIDALLDECSAPAIWDEANERLRSGGLTARGLLRRFDVEALCTTDDPADDLAAHQEIAVSGLATRVYPAYRPDRALQVGAPDALAAWLERLGGACGRHAIATLPELVAALEERHAAFHGAGCRLSDHGLPHAYADPATDAEAAAIFARARAGTPAAPAEQARFAAYLMLRFGRWNAERGWTMQLHLGPVRNLRARALRQLGPDTGFDAVGDDRQIDALAGFLDRLDQEGALPRTVLYNVNPAHNDAFAALTGCFQGEIGHGATPVPGKMQYGAAWWFMDSKDGITRQLDALSSSGLLSRFIGMLTDSRSFLSFPRHEYFRRVLCDLLGAEMERGELPSDDALIGGMVADICARNARRYLALPYADAG